MKNFLQNPVLVVTSTLLMTGLLSGSVLAQDDSEAERRVNMEQRRAEYLENNPEVAARLETRRQEREAFLENNPDVAARADARRAQARERFDNNEGRPPRGQRPGADGRRQGPSPDFEREDRPRDRFRSGSAGT